MGSKINFWRMRMIISGICLFFVININHIYGAELGKTENFQNAEAGSLIENTQQDCAKNEEDAAEDDQIPNGTEIRQDTGQNQTVKAMELDLGEYQAAMEVGETQLLTVTVLPLDASDQTVHYASGNEEVASINSMGRIRANAPGTAKIKVSCGEVKESFTLAVTVPKDTEEKTVAVTDIEISDYEKELEVDKTMMLTATVLPTDATENTISYRSSDSGIATVNSSGEVKGIAKGNAAIYCTAGGITKEVPVTVKVATKKLNINHTYLVLKPGQCETLKTTVMPAGAPQGITYKSSDPKIADVSAGGTVTAKSCGNTGIIVSNEDASISVSVIVNESAQSGAIEETIIKEQDSQADFPEETDVSKTPVITSQMLHYFYQEKKTLSVHGAGYTVLIHGEDIVNDKNAVSAQISFRETPEGTVFELNEGKELCGPIVLCLEQAKGNYLYLYNTSQKKYQFIENTEIRNLKLTSGGTYLLADKRLPDHRKHKMAYAGGLLCCFVIAAVYVGVKKKYWFW